jgi:parallel beta-helix repeat protein
MLMVFLAFTSISPTIPAATLHVGSGQTYSTIQSAVNAASAGDTIIVHAGTYNEQVIINKDLTLQGDSGVKITAPSSRKSFTISESSKVWDPIIFAFGGTLSSSNAVSGSGTVSVTVDGFEIDGGNSAVSNRFTAILFRNVDPGSISNNDIHDMYDSDGMGDGPETFGIIVYGDSEVTIESNIVKDFSRGGIGSNGDWGSLPDPTVDILGNIVYGNGLETLTGWWAENGIQIGFQASGSIYGNQVYNCRCNNVNWGSSGILLYASNDDIENNYVENCDFGIYFDSNSKVIDNEVCDSGWAFIDYSIASNIGYNYIHDNDVAVYCEASSDIHWNIIVDNNYGIVVDKKIIPPTTIIPSKPTINYNCIAGNKAYGVYNFQNVAIDATHNLWGSPSGPEHTGTWIYMGSTYGPNYGYGDKVTNYVLYDDWNLGHYEITVEVTPNSLNLESKGNYMNLKITSIPTGYSLSDIEGDTVMMMETIPSESYDVTGQSFSAKFDRAEFEDQTAPGDVVILITGQFNDGTYFYGYDTINAHQ